MFRVLKNTFLLQPCFQMVCEICIRSGCFKCYGVEKRWLTECQKIGIISRLFSFLDFNVTYWESKKYLFSNTILTFLIDTSFVRFFVCHSPEFSQIQWWNVTSSELFINFFWYHIFVFLRNLDLPSFWRRETIHWG